MAGGVDVTVGAGLPDPRTADRLLRLLPDWFGIESANLEYIEAARHLPTYLAWVDDGPPLSILLIRRHFPEAAEVHLMAVHPDWQRRGIGRRLLADAERDLRAEGVRLLQVKTLGYSCPHEGYRRTREFYLGVGFAPLEEIVDLWPGNPCLIMVKSLGPGLGC